MTKDNAPSLYELADQFINLANELAQQDGSGTVGTAIRYAAARYNAFEASNAADDLAGQREHFLTAFSDDYRKMFEENIDLYIEQAMKS